MADPVIKVKRSAVAGKIPTTNDLQLGELAINTYDGRVYIEQDQGAVGVGTTIIAINPWSVGVGSNTYNTYFTQGNVGIGSTLPTSKLSVVGNGNFSGVVTASAFYGSGANLSGIIAETSTNVIGGVSSVTSLNVTGISTLGTVRISSGIVTATSGVVTYYGDGSKLTGIAAVARVTVSQTAPSSPTAGDLWYHTTLARLFVYFNDGDSNQWVDAAPFNLQGSGAAAVSVGATAPIGPSSGDLWYNSDYGRLFVYYKDGSSDQWVDAAPFNYPATDTPTKTENSFVATAGQTTFTVTYEVGFIEVYLNGIRLSSSEYTANSGTSVVLAEAAALGDIIDIIEIATGRGPTGAQGPAGETTLAGIGTTSETSAHFPVFVSGLGNTSPYISTTSNYFSFIPSSGTLSVNQFNAGVTTATRVTVQSLNCSGVATATDFNSTSDINLKDNIKVIDNPLEKVLQISGVSFDWKDTGKSSAGVIAQDVEKVMPGIIHDNSTGYKSLNYNGLIGLLIEAVKEQNETIEVLKKKINTLEEGLG